MIKSYDLKMMLKDGLESFVDDEGVLVDIDTEDTENGFTVGFEEFFFDEHNGKPRHRIERIKYKVIIELVE